MSGDLKDLKSRKYHKKKQRSSWMTELNEKKKKAKLLIAEPPHPEECITCRQCPRADRHIICGLCGGKNSIIDTSKLDLSRHQAVDQVCFGKGSLVDSDYQAVLSMLPQELIHDFCSFFVKECRNGNAAMSQEDLQLHLDSLNTKAIIRKFVAFRRKQVEQKKTGNTESILMKKEIKSLKNKVAADVRHQLYMLLYYCKQSYPKLKLATMCTKSDDVRLIYKHIPKVRELVVCMMLYMFIMQVSMPSTHWGNRRGMTRPSCHHCLYNLQFYV